MQSLVGHATSLQACGSNKASALATYPHRSDPADELSGQFNRASVAARRVDVAPQGTIQGRKVGVSEPALGRHLVAAEEGVVGHATEHAPVSSLRDLDGARIQSSECICRQAVGVTYSSAGRLLGVGAPER